MSRYEEGLKLIEERCGNGKDNVISLSTIAIEPSSDGKPRPYVRDVDAYYEDDVFYISITVVKHIYSNDTTWQPIDGFFASKSNQEHEKKKEVTKSDANNKAMSYGQSIIIMYWKQSWL